MMIARSLIILLSLGLLISPAHAEKVGPPSPPAEVHNDYEKVDGNVTIYQNRVYTVYFNDYDEMYKACGTSKCCRASVRRIRKAQVKPEYVSRDASLVCPENFRKTSVRCPASLIWCESELRPKE
ncbi:MAG: hypothetical protein MRY32_00180 [Rickettsiales bacterium]|nr:hypothetical protein [Rickettsiales bacterium]